VAHEINLLRVGALRISCAMRADTTDRIADHNLVLFVDGASSLLPSLHPGCGFRAFLQMHQNALLNRLKRR
jgi:hypothetical protein